MRPVGILGGMGPEATLVLMRKVLDAVAAADDSDHVPLIVHQNPQVPSRIAHLVDGTGADPAPVLAGMARALAAAGAEALAMPCNTAHAYRAAILKAIDLPFLDMVTLTAEAIPPGSTVGLLASPATRKAGVFDAAFAARGIEARHPDPDAALALVRAVKRGEGAPDDLATLADALGAVDRHVVACTEFSLLAHGLGGRPRTDALDCLTAAIVAFARESA